MAEIDGSTYRTIPVSELEPGMQIVDLGYDWLKRPYLYAENKKIASREEVDAICAQGYLEAVIDLLRSDQDILPRARQISRPLVNPTDKTPLEEELPLAVQVHDHGVAYARRFMDDMREGRLNMNDAGPVVEDIMESLGRNADALISLSRLRRRDAYTYAHCLNVAILTTAFMRYLERPESEVFTAGYAGLFHDLGKALIPENILNAPRGLMEREMEVMKKHPQHGYDQLSQVPDIPSDVLLGALQHHERFDGSGYPQGLDWEQISLIGRVVGIADVYDALTSRRVYKKGMFPHKALGMMYEMRDKSFSHEMISQFIRMVGIYPVGSVVSLEDGSMAVVAGSNEQRPTHPEVIIVRNPKGISYQSGRILVAGEECPAIVQCVPDIGTGIDPRSVLGIPI